MWLRYLSQDSSHSGGVGCTPLRRRPSPRRRAGGSCERVEVELRNRVEGQHHNRSLVRERTRESTTCCATGKRADCGVTIYFSSPSPAVVPIGLAILEAETRRLS